MAVRRIPYHLDEYLPDLDLPLRLLAGYRPELIATGLGLRPVPEHRVMLAGARELTSSSA